MAGKRFWQKIPVDFAHTLQVKKLVEITLTHSVSEINMFYAKIQDGCQKWQENDFCENSPVESAHTVWFKNLVEISLASSVSEINPFFAFYAEIQDGRQKWQENTEIRDGRQK